MWKLACGASAATHERQNTGGRGASGGWRALEQMQALGLRMQLRPSLPGTTEMEAMGALAERMALPLRWNMQITPRDNGDRAPLDIATPRPRRSVACGGC